MKNFNSNVAWSILSQFSNYGLSLIFTIFLARMILPYEYGIVNQAQTITAFFIVFADGGIVWSIVREKFIKDHEVINLFWINTALGFVLFSLCWLVAPFVSSFYNSPEVENVLKCLGVIFILTGLSTPFSMWLKRTMEFKKITLMNITSASLSGMIAIWAALNDYGYWSLVILALSKGILYLILLVIFSKMPIGFYKMQVSVKHMIKFGIGLIGFGVVNYFARNLDNILIGKIGGAEQLALYAKAYFLMFLPSMLITGALSGLMVAVLSKVQDEPERFQDIYNKVLRMIFVVTLPVTGYFLFFPKDPIFLFYGSNWDGSIILLQLLAIAAITQPLYNTMGWIYTAIGKSKEMFHWGIISSIILSTSFFIGIQWGAIGISITYSIVMGIFFVYFGLNRAHKLANIKLGSSFSSLYIIGLIGIVSLVSVKLIASFINIENQYLEILVKIILLLSIYISLLYLKYKNDFMSIFKIERGIS